MRVKQSFIAALVLMITLAGMALAADVIVYASAHESTLARWANLYERETGRTVEFMRLSAGEMVARTQAEMARPQADVVSGIPAAFMAVLREEGAIRPTFPENAAHFPADLHQADGYWYGTDATILGMLVNESVFQREWPDHEYPETWDDFLRPEYAGWVVMPDPATSGTAYTFVTAHLLRGGEEDWSYLEQYVGQVDLFTSSGVAPARMASIGEYAFAVTFAHDALVNIQAGFPARFVVPGATGGTVGTTAAVVGGPSGDEAADHYIDWLMSLSPQQLLVDLQFVASMHEEVILPAAHPDITAVEFVAVDPEWAATERDRILERWEDVVDAAQ